MGYSPMRLVTVPPPALREGEADGGQPQSPLRKRDDFEAIPLSSPFAEGGWKDFACSPRGAAHGANGRWGMTNEK